MVGGVKVDVGVSAHSIMASARLSRRESTLLRRYMKSIGPGEKSLFFISSKFVSGTNSSVRLNPTADDSKELGSVAFAIVTILGTGEDEPLEELSFFAQLTNDMMKKSKSSFDGFLIMQFPLVMGY